jgi:RNA polymerase-binding transcription factor DksA
MDPAKARKLLEARREDLRSIVRTASEQGGLDEEQRSSAGEMSPFDPGDIGTDTFERELDLSVRETAEASLRDVDAAFGRLEKGTYGICPVCDEPIDDERLEAKPEAEFCVRHQPTAAASSA